MINVDESRTLNVFIRDMKIASCYHQRNILRFFFFLETVKSIKYWFPRLPVNSDLTYST